MMFTDVIKVDSRAVPVVGSAYIYLQTTQMLQYALL